MEEMIKKLEERRATLIEQSNKSTDVAELKAINQQLKTLNNDISELRAMDAKNRILDRTEIENDPNTKAIATSADYVPGKGFISAENRNSITYDSTLEQREKAGRELRSNRSVKSPISTFGELRAVTVGGGSSILVPSFFGENITPAFSVVSSLIDSVAHLSLNGGETFKQAYVTDIETGNYTAEGADAASAETKFDYADINRTKVTAYAELTEELQKLPDAAYADTVFQNIRTSMRKLLTKEILIGVGGNNQIVGIFSNRASAIDPATDLSLSAITDTTLDEILFNYGGEEDVEAPAVLILNKLDLLAFSKVRTSTKQKFYDINLNGNGGTINGVPFIINSACKSLMASGTQTGDFCMAYGVLSNYLLVEFSPMEVKRSEDYRFKQGMTAFRGNCFFGGNCIKKNGFLRVKKSA